MGRNNSKVKAKRSSVIKKEETCTCQDMPSKIYDDLCGQYNYRNQVKSIALKYKKGVLMLRYLYEFDNIYEDINWVTVDKINNLEPSKALVKDITDGKIKLNSIETKGITTTFT